MENTVLYIKIEQNNMIQSETVYLKDIAKLYCMNRDIVNELNNLMIMRIKSNKSCKYIVSILKIIEHIKNIYPKINVINLGETDIIINYTIQRKTNPLIQSLKVIFVSISVFMGAAFTIMTFNIDVSVSEVFDMFYELVMNEPKTGPTILELSYAIGLPIGIIVFFNHFSKFKLHDDPTPITIQMRLYEEDVNKTLIADASREGKVIDVDS